MVAGSRSGHSTPLGITCFRFFRVPKKPKTSDGQFRKAKSSGTTEHLMAAVIREETDKLTALETERARALEASTTDLTGAEEAVASAIAKSSGTTEHLMAAVIREETDKLTALETERARALEASTTDLTGAEEAVASAIARSEEGLKKGQQHNIVTKKGVGEQGADPSSPTSGPSESWLPQWLTKLISEEAAPSADKRSLAASGTNSGETLEKDQGEKKPTDVASVGLSPAAGAAEPRPTDETSGSKRKKLGRASSAPSEEADFITPHRDEASSTSNSNAHDASKRRLDRQAAVPDLTTGTSSGSKGPGHVSGDHGRAHVSGDHVSGDHGSGDHDRTHVSGDHVSGVLGSSFGSDEHQNGAERASQDEHQAEHQAAAATARTSSPRHQADERHAQPRADYSSVPWRQRRQKKRKDFFWERLQEARFPEEVFPRAPPPPFWEHKKRRRARQLSSTYVSHYNQLMSLRHDREVSEKRKTLLMRVLREMISRERDKRTAQKKTKVVLVGYTGETTPLSPSSSDPGPGLAKGPEPDSHVATAPGVRQAIAGVRSDTDDSLPVREASTTATTAADFVTPVGKDIAASTVSATAADFVTLARKVGQEASEGAGLPHLPGEGPGAVGQEGGALADLPGKDLPTLPAGPSASQSSRRKEHGLATQVTADLHLSTGEAQYDVVRGGVPPPTTSSSLGSYQIGGSSSSRSVPVDALPTSLLQTAALAGDGGVSRPSTPGASPAGRFADGGSAEPVPHGDPFFSGERIARPPPDPDKSPEDSLLVHYPAPDPDKSPEGSLVHYPPDDEYSLEASVKYLFDAYGMEGLEDEGRLEEIVSKYLIPFTEVPLPHQMSSKTPMPIDVGNSYHGSLGWGAAQSPPEQGELVNSPSPSSSLVNSPLPYGLSGNEKWLVSLRAETTEVLRNAGLGPELEEALLSNGEPYRGDYGPYPEFYPGTSPLEPFYDPSPYGDARRSYHYTGDRSYHYSGHHGRPPSISGSTCTGKGSSSHYLCTGKGYNNTADNRRGKLQHAVDHSTHSYYEEAPAGGPPGRRRGGFDACYDAWTGSASGHGRRRSPGNKGAQLSSHHHTPHHHPKSAPYNSSKVPGGAHNNGPDGAAFSTYHALQGSGPGRFHCGGRDGDDAWALIREAYAEEEDEEPVDKARPHHASGPAAEIRHREPPDKADTLDSASTKSGPGGHSPDEKASSEIPSSQDVRQNASGKDDQTSGEDDDDLSKADVGVDEDDDDDDDGSDTDNDSADTRKQAGNEEVQVHLPPRDQSAVSAEYPAEGRVVYESSGALTRVDSDSADTAIGSSNDAQASALSLRKKRKHKKRRRRRKRSAGKGVESSTSSTAAREGTHNQLMTQPGAGQSQSADDTKTTTGWDNLDEEEKEDNGDSFAGDEEITARRRNLLATITSFPDYTGWLQIVMREKYDAMAIYDAINPLLVNASSHGADKFWLGGAWYDVGEFTCFGGSTDYVNPQYTLDYPPTPVVVANSSRMLQEYGYGLSSQPVVGQQYGYGLGPQEYGLNSQPVVGQQYALSAGQAIGQPPIAWPADNAYRMGMAAQRMLTASMDFNSTNSTNSTNGTEVESASVLFDNSTMANVTNTTMAIPGPVYNYTTGWPRYCYRRLCYTTTTTTTPKPIALSPCYTLSCEQCLDTAYSNYFPAATTLACCPAFPIRDQRREDYSEA